jgi:hypothetical protein
MPSVNRWGSKQGIQGSVIYGHVVDSPGTQHWNDVFQNSQWIEYKNPAGRRCITYVFLGVGGRLHIAYHQPGEIIPLVYVASDPYNPVALNMANPFSRIPFGMFFLGIGLFVLGVVGVIQGFKGDLTAIMIKPPSWD